MTDVESAAVSIITRAVKLDSGKRYTEALVCYQEGLELLMKAMKGSNCALKKAKLREKVEGFMDRAEKLKNYVEQEKEKGSYHEQIVIENDSTGHSYQNLIGRFLDEEISQVSVEDPYIRSFHQCENFVKLCELLVKTCPNLRKVRLITSSDRGAKDQASSLDMTKTSLKKYNVDLEVDFSDTLHDRQIRLSNGWVIKIGRGLDYFKPPDGRCALGYFDMDLRPCKETVVDVFHVKDVKLSYG
ncbi:MIT domain-containing protein 1-like [Ischnura elegans]|uniref:MIT domain-containing protein 1-like n=1 Tax=Ischnura elegans TaxID=197161 RepID=UPI001ED8A7E5|nr:MIT domain-containing protein 1-like [Ischnura elegans]